jgi:predicted lipoprotein with Yx(FWY)xxD motif
MASMSGCSDDDDDDVVSQEETSVTIKIIANEDFGKILVDKNNQTMYFFAKDVKGAGANCSGGCATNWPAVTGEVSDLDLDASLSAGDFGTVTLGDGQKQLTYKDWSLYYFAPGGTLEAAGEVTGDGGGNGTFFVAKPDYTVMLAQQAVVAGESPVMYLVDYRGVTLYTLSIDNENLSNCDGSCPSNWPALAATDELMLPSALSSDDFAKAGTQLTFKGSPLYFFKNDENIRGNVKGQGAAGGKFMVAVPEGLATQPGKTIKLVEHEAFGKILVNQENQSIYFFAKDVINAGANCSGGCLNSWKAATGDLADLGIGFGLSADDFGTVTLANDDKQITYKAGPCTTSYKAVYRKRQVRWAATTRLPTRFLSAGPTIP